MTTMTMTTHQTMMMMADKVVRIELTENGKSLTRAALAAITPPKPIDRLPTERPIKAQYNSQTARHHRTAPFVVDNSYSHHGCVLLVCTVSSPLLLVFGWVWGGFPYRKSCHKANAFDWLSYEGYTVHWIEMTRKSFSLLCQ